MNDRHLHLENDGLLTMEGDDIIVRSKMAIRKHHQIIPIKSAIRILHVKSE